MKIDNYRLILASTSPRRKHLMQNICTEFEIMAPLFEEKRTEGESPEDYAKRNSLGKALSVSEQITNFDKPTVIIAADTFVIINNQILEKPKSKQEASDMLNLLSGSWHNIYTSFTIAYKTNKQFELKITTNLVKSKAKFKKITQAEIDNYIVTGEPMDKAGAYALQGKGAVFIEEVQGSRNNIIGLPVEEIQQELNKFLT